MASTGWTHTRIGSAMIAFSVLITGCSIGAKGRFYGETIVPKNNVLRYVSGSEPESLDPAIPTGQPEARVLMALFDGLIEYHPKTMEPMAGIAETWEIAPDATEYVFHLRNNATFSNGDAITAHDFVYSIRRALDPTLAAKNAYLAYYIKYAEAFNSARAFVKRPDGSFVLKNDPADGAATLLPGVDNFGGDSEFHRFLDAPERLTVSGDEKERTEAAEKDPKLKQTIAGAEFVPVKAEDIGVEAIDEYTVRIKLTQPAPFFIGLLGHQFFRIVHRPTIEKYGSNWTKPANIVTSGAFKLVEHRPYDRVVVRKEPTYWDAEMVRLDGIDFYPLDEQTTMMNLYKAGGVDATYNHTVPAPWFEVVSQYKDEYMNHPEVTIDYYTFNVKKPPMNSLKVRQAFALAIDREALSKFRKTTKPLVDFSPEGIFPKYEDARERVYKRELAKIGSSLEEWKARIFDAEKARKLLGEAGFPVQKNGNTYSVPNFPVESVELFYNTSESNKAIAEFVQAQWKQNLGIVVPIRNMEWKTFLNVRKELDYNGIARAGWVGDYMDPYTFLNLFYSENNDSSTGWFDPKFDKMMDEANKEIDEMKRFEKLAEAEFYMMKDQPILPLQTHATNWIKKPYVKGLYPNPGTLHPWKFVYLEQDSAKWDTDVDNIMKTRDEWVYQHVDRLTAKQNQLMQSKKSEAAKSNASGGE